MDLTVGIVTGDLPALRSFYRTLFRMDAVGDDAYCEFRMDGWTLALVTAGSIDSAVPGAHAPARNRSVRLELSVEDVDAEFERVQPSASEVVAPPTDWPWGARSAWIRDPDGNLVSLYRMSERSATM